MNTEIPNNNPEVGSSPVSAVVPPVMDTPVPAAPAIDVASATPELPLASEPTVSAPEVSTPVVDVPAVPAEPIPEAAPVVEPIPAAPVTPEAIPEMPEVAPVPAEPVTPEVALVPEAPFAPAPEVVTPVVDNMPPVTPAESIAPVVPEVAPVPEVPATPETTPMGFAAPAEPVDQAVVDAFTASSVPPVEPAQPAPVQPATVGLPDQNIQSAPAETVKKKSKAPAILLVVVLLAVLGFGGWYVWTNILSKPKSATPVNNTVTPEEQEPTGDEEKDVETGEGGEGTAQFGTLSDRFVDLKNGAETAYKAEQLKTSDAVYSNTSDVCYSLEYLVSQGLIKTDYMYYTGSVLFKKGNGVDPDTYYIWLSDGTMGFEKANYTVPDYEQKELTKASNNCGGEGTYYCGTDGTCK